MANSPPGKKTARAMETTARHAVGSAAGGREDHPAGGREILLVYDRECPARENYCRNVRVGPSAGRLRPVNARELSAVMWEISEAGLDIDQGTVVKMGGQLYYGSDAIHALALLTRGDRGMAVEAEPLDDVRTDQPV